MKAKRNKAPTMPAGADVSTASLIAWKWAAMDWADSWGAGASPTPHKPPTVDTK